MIGPITILPMPVPVPNPGIVPPWLREPRNGGVVPPWLERDLGHEATHPTTNPTWHADFTK